MQRLADMLTKFSSRHQSESEEVEQMLLFFRTTEDTAHPDDTLRRVLKPRWRTGNPWLLDCYDEVAGREEVDRCDEKAGREERSLPTFDLQCCSASSVVYGYK